MCMRDTNAVLCSLCDVAVNWDAVYRHRGMNKFVVHTRMCRNVGVLRLFPGITEMMVSCAESSMLHLYRRIIGMIASFAEIIHPLLHRSHSRRVIGVGCGLFGHHHHYY